MSVATVTFPPATKLAVNSSTVAAPEVRATGLAVLGHEGNVSRSPVVTSGPPMTKDGEGSPPVSSSSSPSSTVGLSAAPSARGGRGRGMNRSRSGSSGQPGHSGATSFQASPKDDRKLTAADFSDVKGVYKNCRGIWAAQWTDENGKRHTKYFNPKFFADETEARIEAYKFKVHISQEVERMGGVAKRKAPSNRVSDSMTMSAAATPMRTRRGTVGRPPKTSRDTPPMPPSFLSIQLDTSAHLPFESRPNIVDHTDFGDIDYSTYDTSSYATDDASGPMQPGAYQPYGQMSAEALSFLGYHQPLPPAQHAGRGMYLRQYHPHSHPSMMGTDLQQMGGQMVQYGTDMYHTGGPAGGAVYASPSDAQKYADASPLQQQFLYPMSGGGMMLQPGMSQSMSHPPSAQYGQYGAHRYYALQPTADEAACVPQSEAALVAQADMSQNDTRECNGTPATSLKAPSDSLRPEEVDERLGNMQQYATDLGQPACCMCGCGEAVSGPGEYAAHHHDGINGTQTKMSVAGAEESSTNTSPFTESPYESPLTNHTPHVPHVAQAESVSHDQGTSGPHHLTPGARSGSPDFGSSRTQPSPSSSRQKRQRDSDTEDGRTDSGNPKKVARIDPGFGADHEPSPPSTRLLETAVE